MKESIIHKSVTNIVAQATTQQRTASDPAISSWVGASAGSGKTKVLTDRMLRLLLPREDGRPGTPPEKILALTFTKAAANEMALRLSKSLSEWAVMDDDALSKDMRDNLFGRDPTPEERRAARKLFTRVIDTAGGLNIMTIHSFCQSVLGRFPIEAGLPPQFQPLEESEQADLLKQAQSKILSKASGTLTSPLARAVRSISAAVNEEQFASLLQTLLGERHQMSRILKRNFGIDGLYTNLCSFLAITPGVDDAEAVAQFCRQTSPEAALRGICPALSASKSAGDHAKAQKIQAFWDAQAGARVVLYNDYKNIFLTSENDVRSAEKITTKAVDQADPQAREILMREAARIFDFEESRKAIQCASLTRDLFLIGDAILEEYAYLKNQRGLLDFDDLIIRTLALLKGETVNLAGQKMTPWILYKLDEGLDHVLVDEAQDTNPEQWEIIQQISDDFFDGQAAKDNSRSIFVVGDKKQSIFSFQRAAPEKFDEIFDWFERKIGGSGEAFVPVNINTSFRSVQILLDAVDRVFAKDQKASVLSTDYAEHVAKRQGQAGLVELWPVFKTRAVQPQEQDSASQKPKGWFLPDRIIESQSGSMQMAWRIADTISGWIKGGEILESYGRPIHPGDIMVLVRARGAFVSQLVRALKTKAIPVSGVDRMILGDQLVVQDLVAAAGFALLPDDDLTLATLLKSPFIGYSEDALYALCHQRPGTLWDRVRQSDNTAAAQWLERLITLAGSEHPYEFFSRIIQEPCPADARSGNHAIRVRLGEDALDPLDEFLNMSLAYETNHCAGLQGFVHWHRSGQSEIKRQMEEGTGAVRIMTVHGSKGLQAPIVFLPDTIRTAASVKVDKILWPHKTSLEVTAYVSSKTVLPKALLPAYRSIEQKLDEEYRRLLYVAMTRAEERLYIGGFTGKRGPSDDSKTSYWYDDIRSAFEGYEGVERISAGIKDEDDGDMPILRLSSKRTSDPDKTKKAFEEHAEQIPVMPDWIYKAAPAEPYPPRPLVPSRPSDAEPAAASPRKDKDLYRFRRGTVTHKLLQTLPTLPESAWENAARQFVAKPALKLPEEIQENIVREIMAILRHPDFGPIFGPQSLAEVPVSGLLGQATMVSGQIDRLLITDKEILIIDYKTNRPPPLNAEDVPPVYVRQMAAYAQTLRLIYPGHTVRCALLWTDGPRLMTLDV